MEALQESQQEADDDSQPKNFCVAFFSMCCQMGFQTFVISDGLRNSYFRSLVRGGRNTLGSKRQSQSVGQESQLVVIDERVNASLRYLEFEDGTAASRNAMGLNSFNWGFAVINAVENSTDDVS